MKCNITSGVAEVEDLAILLEQFLLKSSKIKAHTSLPTEDEHKRLKNIRYWGFNVETLMSLRVINI